MEGGTAGAGSCGSGATYDGSGLRTANTTPPNANYILSNNAVGVVPVRSLGLPNDFAFDPWGGRFTYAVDKRFTATSAMSTYAISNNTGAITINDNSGNAIVSNAITVIISHGENGHGAFLLSGNRKNGGSTNANEQVNCHCNASGTAAALTSVFVAGKNTTTDTSTLLAIYDDVTRYYGRGNFPSYSDPSSESK